MPRPFSADMEAISPIKIDITEDDKAYTIRAEIPGVKKEDIKAQVNGNVVSISAETKRKKRQKRKRKKGELFAVNAARDQVTVTSR